jgi:hypothetical protein
MIPRQKTAIRRADFSRPMKAGLEDGLIDCSSSVFDYMAKISRCSRPELLRATAGILRSALERPGTPLTG